MFTCTKCDEEFDTGPELGEHHREAHPQTKEKKPSGKGFVCGDCGNQRELPSYWNPHIAPPDESETMSGYQDTTPSGANVRISGHPRRRLCKECWRKTWWDTVRLGITKKLEAIFGPREDVLEHMERNPEAMKRLKNLEG